MMKQRSAPGVVLILVTALLLASSLAGIPFWNRAQMEGQAAPSTPRADPTSYLPLVVKSSPPSPEPDPGPGPGPLPTPVAGEEWAMVAASPQRTSLTDAQIAGDLQVEWYRPVEAYIPQHVQVIAANGLLYLSTADGLVALRADNGQLAWRFDTEMPLGHSPSIDTRTQTLYVGGLDRRLYALNALTGALLWSFDGAGAGYDTNPLVVEGKVILGNRDGAVYAVGAQGSAQAGQLLWKYQTGGPVRFSPAYHEGFVYFASNDQSAYALRAGDGGLVWKSAKMSGDGFQSYWPVVYTDPASGEDYVIFAAGNGYRAFMSPGSGSLDCGGYEWCEWYDEFGGDVSGALGPAVEINEPWAQGKTVVDYSRLAEYFEANPNPDPHAHKPYRRFYYVFQAGPGNGQSPVELTMDSDGDGYPEYAPVDPFLSNSGNPYPPVVGADGMLYLGNHYEADGQSRLMGWRLGTPYFTLTPLRGAGDEPNAFSAGGDRLYRSICCDRSADWTSLDGQQGTLWNYDLAERAPGYDEQWWFDDPNVLARLAGNYGTVNGVYHSHGDQNPPVPYGGRVYIHRSNAVIAFGKGQPLGKLATVHAASGGTSGQAISRAGLKARLEAEVTKLVSAGHLRPGYYNAGQFNSAYSDLANYFSNPGETLYTLSIAYPHLSSSLQGQLRTYLKAEFNAYFRDRMVSSMGWSSGASREWMPLPPEVQADLANYGPVENADANLWAANYPQYNFYGMWKYVELVAPEDAQAAYNLAKSRLQPNPPSAAFFEDIPWILNGYIAGYIGFVGLQDAAGMAGQDSALRSQVSAALNQLLSLRATSFSKDTSYQTFDQYTKRTLNIARNFIYLTPELGAYLRQNALQKVQGAVAEYEQVAPYWFVSRYTASIGESTLQNLYDYPALFQAKAYILGESQAELSKYIDVPAFARGDLFYLQNLVAALEAD